MRTPKERRIQSLPQATHYKPSDAPQNNLQCVRLRVDQLEAMRLVDVQGLSQEQAARSMGVSTSTICRMLKEGRRTVTQALVAGIAISIEGGMYRLHDETSSCHRHGHGYGGGHGGGKHHGQ